MIKRHHHHASAAFAVPLLVLVVDERDGVQHRGTLQLPRRAPGRPSSADLARLRPFMSALGDRTLAGVCTAVQRLLNQVPINNIISLDRARSFRLRANRG
jgi:hypothetical protein